MTSTTFCKDCRHVRVKETRQHVCKLNCVYRNPLDACLLKTRFERRTLDDPPKDIVEELERFLVWQNGLVDDEDKRNGQSPSDVVLDKIVELKKKWCWY